MKLNIDIPTSLSEITLRQYKKFLKLQKTSEDERFLTSKMIEIFCNLDLKDVMLLKLKDTDKISIVLSNMFESKPKLVTRFKIGSKEYGFHPQLDDLTLGEYIDLDTYLGDWENIEKAMNVLYRPITTTLNNKYSIKEYKLGTEQVLLDMPMDAVMSSIFFFWNLGLELSEIMTNFLDNPMEENQALIQYLNSEINGGGISQFTDSLQEILQDLKISLN